MGVEIRQKVQAGGWKALRAREEKLQAPSVYPLGPRPQVPCSGRMDHWLLSRGSLIALPRSYNLASCCQGLRNPYILGLHQSRNACEVKGPFTGDLYEGRDTKRCHLPWLSTCSCLGDETQGTPMLQRPSLVTRKSKRTAASRWVTIPVLGIKS